MRTRGPFWRSKLITGAERRSVKMGHLRIATLFRGYEKCPKTDLKWTFEGRIEDKATLRIYDPWGMGRTKRHGTQVVRRNETG